MTLYKLNLNKKNIKEDHPTGATAGGQKLALILHKGKVYALDAVCTHEEGPLDEGSVEGDQLICPWHQGAYDIMTGKADPNTNWVHNTKTFKIVEDSTGELSAEM